MLTELMSYKEQLSALAYDWQTLCAGAIPKFGAEYDNQRRKLKVKKEKPYPVWYSVTTPTKNKWYLLFSKRPSANKYQGQPDINILGGVLMETNNGLRFVKYNSPQAGGISIYYGHLFKRYNERLGLNLTEPLQKIKHFFINNGYAVVKLAMNEERALFTSCADGALLGYMSLDKYAVIHKTFISHNEINSYQSALRQSLTTSLTGDIETILNEAEFDKDTYYYIADIIKSVVTEKKQPS